VDSTSYAQIEKDIEDFLNDSQNALIVVVGPTASGQTSLAVKLAQKFNGEVINADSRQVYQEMEIGNELTKPEEMQGVPHHLLSFQPVSETLSVAEYKQKAEEVIADLQSRGKAPILCGGTFLWVDAVVDNFQIPAGDPDWEYRRELEQESTDDLLIKLENVDPESSQQLAPEKNKRYIIRALEIFRQTGKKKSELAQKSERQYDVFKVAPSRDREEIYSRINERTKYQFDHGMIEEVQNLVNKYAEAKPEQLLELGWPSISSIGCKEVVPYLTGEKSKEATLAQLQQNNRNYAKRQLTWLRKDEEINWVEI